MSDPKKEFPFGDGETQNSGRPAVDSPEPVNPPTEGDKEAAKDGEPDYPGRGQDDAS